MGLTGTAWYEDRVTTDQKVGGSSPSGRATETLVMYGLFEPNRPSLSWETPTDSHSDSHRSSNMVLLGTNLLNTTSQAAAHIAGYGRLIEGVVAHPAPCDEDGHCDEDEVHDERLVSDRRA
jgi:hypothetical protein